MQTIDELVEQASALQGLEPAHRTQIAGCARNRVFEPGEQIMREGDPADAFYVIRAGAVALETAVPGRGPVMLQTLHDGEILGWSWLVAPHRTAFDARALDVTHTIAFDGACLRGRCESDPGIGFDLLKLVASVLAERLQDTRLRLLDLYGQGGRA
jgi:CRP-like cAMP-binding protein